MTYHEIIDETVKYYSEDVTRRSILRGTCRYFGPNGQRCAFSRVWNDDVTLTQIKKEGESAYGLFRDGFISDKDLKEQYRGKDEMFWIDLQHLHDDADAWDKAGITQFGRDSVQRLKNIWNDQNEKQ